MTASKDKGRSNRRVRLIWAGAWKIVQLVLLSAALNAPMPASAEPIQGWFTGSLACGPVGRDPSFESDIAVELRGGRFRLEGGEPGGKRWFRTMTGLVDGSGAVLVVGAYWSGTYKPIELNGTIRDSRLVASGRVGPRTCKMTLLARPKTNPGPLSANRWRGPFNLAALQLPARDRSVGRFSCPEVGASIPRDLEVYDFYTDPKHSIVDPAKRDARARATRSVSRFESAVGHAEDAFVRTRADAARACLLSHLDAWASGDALTGALTEQGIYERRWNLAVVALAWLKLAPDDLVPGDIRARVEGWIAGTADAVMAETANLGPSSQRNNLSYWAGLAVGASGAAIRSPELLDWGFARYRSALRQIRADGTLDLEMQRGSKALHYHCFALMPLVMLAELGSANGLDLYAEQNGALHRLAKVTLNGLKNPRLFETEAGAAQNSGTEQGFEAQDYGWLEPYGARFPNADIEELLQGRRPIVFRWAGGDLTSLFAQRANARAVQP